MRILLLSLAFIPLLLGCKDANQASDTRATAENAQAGKSTISLISVQAADEALQSGAVAVDANSDSTREKKGTVPNAVILTSSYKYELTELPQDKSKDLIFYCANTHCNASDAAAERAASNGYEKVHVMREGIQGWKDAGKPTAAYPQS